MSLSAFRYLWFLERGRPGVGENLKLPLLQPRLRYKYTLKPDAAKAQPLQPAEGSCKSGSKAPTNLNQGQHESTLSLVSL